MRALITTGLLLLPVLFTQCIDTEVTLLRMQRAVCSSVFNDILQRESTQQDPAILPYSGAVVEISFLTEAIASVQNSGNLLMALGNSRVNQGIDSVSIKSSVSIAPGVDPETELIDLVFTLVHYPNLQLRDYQRTLNQFNEKILDPRLTSQTYYLYFRMREMYTSEPFDLRFTFFRENAEPLSCDCGWMQYI